MQIINGKWVDNNEQPINEFSYDNFKRLKESLSALYGKDITYDSINVVSFLLNKRDGASKLNKIVSNEQILKQL